MTKISDWQGKGKKLQVVIGTDHGGFEMKEKLRSMLVDQGFNAIDVGAHELDPADDYSDFGAAVGDIVAKKQATCGILICRSGICHLLNRSEESFLKIYTKAERIIETMNSIPDDITHLWNQYRLLITRVTAASLVLGTTVITTGCSESAHKYSGGVYKPPVVEKVTDENKADVKIPETEDEAPLQSQSAHKYSGGVYKPTVKDEKDAVITTGPEEKPVSSHRYSGGVYKRPKSKK